MAEHLAQTIDNEATWGQSFPSVSSRGGREHARRAVDAHRVRTPEEVRRADATVGKLLEGQGEGLERLMSLRALSGIAIAIFAGTFIVVAFFAGAGALAIGSGFLFRAFGAALVNRRGQPISRMRALWRAAVTWAPVIATGFVLKYGSKVTDASGAQLSLELFLMAVMIACAAWAIYRPARAIQDRLAGTWIVPR